MLNGEEKAPQYECAFKSMTCQTPGIKELCNALYNATTYVCVKRAHCYELEAFN